MFGAPALWAQLGGLGNTNQGNQPSDQSQVGNTNPGTAQGQVQTGQPMQQPHPAQSPVVPINPVVRNAQKVQQSKNDTKKIQGSEIKTLADIQKGEDRDLAAVRNDSKLSLDTRKKAEKAIRLKYDAMRRDLRVATNKTQHLEDKNERAAKTAEIKAEKKLDNTSGQNTQNQGNSAGQ